MQRRRCKIRWKCLSYQIYLRTQDEFVMSIYWNVSFERRSTKTIKRLKFFPRKKNILAVTRSGIYLKRQQKIRVFAFDVPKQMIRLRIRIWFWVIEKFCLSVIPPRVRFHLKSHGRCKLKKYLYGKCSVCQDGLILFRLQVKFIFLISWNLRVFGPFFSVKFVVNFRLVGSVVFCIHFSDIFNINKGPFPHSRLNM